MNTQAPTPAVGQEITGRGPTYFDNLVLENLLESFMELSAEVWTIRDRQAVLEAVLKDKGIDAAALIEAHRPDADEFTSRKTLRGEYVARLLAGFIRRTDIEDVTS